MPIMSYPARFLIPSQTTCDLVTRLIKGYVMAHLPKTYLFLDLPAGCLAPHTHLRNFQWHAIATIMAKWSKGLYNLRNESPAPNNQLRISASATVAEALKMFYRATFSPPNTRTKDNYLACIMFPAPGSIFHRPNTHMALIIERWGTFSKHLISHWRIGHLPKKYYSLGRQGYSTSSGLDPNSPDTTEVSTLPVRDATR